VIELAIRRPAGTVLLVVGILFAGVAALFQLQVSPLPQIDFPVIEVQAQLPGASPQTMAATVATPLERRLGIIAGVSEMHSVSNAGATEVQLEFDLDRDIDSAARDVQAAIAAARADLPSALPSSPTYRKANPTDAPILIIALTSRSLGQGRLYEAADSVLVEGLSQLGGVGRVNLRGSSLPGVRVDVNPRALAAMGIGVEEVRAALAAANANSPKGALESGDLHYQIYANDHAHRAADFRDAPVAQRDGRLVRMRDVAELSDSVEDIHAYGTANGEPAVVLLVYKQAGANIVETTDRVKAALPALRAALPKDVQLTFGGDRSATIRAALADTEQTLVLGVVLVVLVVFGFLHSWRAVLIPGLTVLAALFGTLAAMYVLGYSLNNLSLLALTIASGFVIDDAIVVLENVTRHMESGTPYRRAALLGTREVAFTVLSMSAALIAVFLPLLLLKGLPGRLIHEFGVTLALSIGISLVLSLTLTPTLCARLLRMQVSPEASTATGPRARIMEVMQQAYAKSLAFALHRPGMLMLVLVGTVALNVMLIVGVPKGLFPEQDSGLILGKIRADPGGSFEVLKHKMNAVEEILRRDAAVETVVTFAGGQDFTSATVFVRLKPLGARDPARVFMTRIRPQLAALPGTQFSMFSIQDLFAEGGQNQGEFQFTLLGDDATGLYAATAKLVAQLKGDARLADVAGEQQSAPAATVVTDRPRLAQFSLSPADVDAALYDALGQRQVSTMYDYRQQYHVVMEAAPHYLQEGAVLSSLFVSPTETRSGGAARQPAVPLGVLGRVEQNRIPNQVDHFGQGVASPVSFNLPPGGTLVDAFAAIDQAIGSLRLPQSIHSTLTGSAGKSKAGSSTGSSLLLLGAALGTVYIVLGILYESYAQPLTILSTLPSAGIGAMLALQLAGMVLTLVAFVGVILVTGIVMKNAILMVDFALQAERERRLEPRAAIHRACLARFRPIMMTTTASLCAAIPMILQSGAGSELRRPLGVSIAGGLIVSQLLTLYTTPVVYLLLDRLRLRIQASQGWRRLVAQGEAQL
jgi:multidrug efflux pump